MSILEEIYNSGLKFLYPLAPVETYKAIVEEAIKLANADSGRLLLSNGKKLEDVYISPNYSPVTKPRAKGYTHKSFFKREAFMITERQLDKIHPEITSNTTTNTVIFIPLENRRESEGVLIIRSKKNKRFTKDEFAAMRLFGNFASLAIRKAKLYEEIEKALETRDLFISMAAHELRTPLTSVNGYIQLLKTRKRKKGKIPDRWIDELELEGNRLKKLVEEFLEINRIKTGKLQYDWKEARLGKILRRAIESFKFLNPNREIAFGDKTVEKDIVVCDPNKLMQVFTNILENADKYSPKDRNIKVELRDRDGTFEVVFEDQGYGISKKEIPLIFGGFYRGKSSRHEGMGLGLYLAKNIIEEHKGNIYIESEVEKGTKVQITLPKI